MTTIKIIDLLEDITELEYMNAITEQLQDNLDSLTDLSNKAQSEQTLNSMALLTWEIARLNSRHEILFNLTKKLLIDTDKKVETALDLLREMNHEEQRSTE